MKYYVHTEKDKQGDYEVHMETCDHLPGALRRKYLGNYSGCQSAVTEAKRLGYRPANGCFHCCRACHTS